MAADTPVVSSRDEAVRTLARVRQQALLPHYSAFLEYASMLRRHNG